MTEEGLVESDSRPPFTVGPGPVPVCSAVSSPRGGACAACTEGPQDCCSQGGGGTRQKLWFLPSTPEFQSDIQESPGQTQVHAIMQFSHI